ncbi:MAG: hypothetical protein AAF551_10810 [Bacteroidota bacterium]
MEYPLADFDQTPVEKLEVTNPVQPEKMEVVESFMKEISAVFNDYEKVFRSDISWNAINGEIYFHNSEGTTYQIPHNSVALVIRVDMLSESGSFKNDVLTFFDADPRNVLDKKEEIKDKIAQMVQALTQRVSTQNSIEDFYGPVLITEELSASFFADNLLMNQQIGAKREPLSINSKQQALNYFQNIKKNHEAEERIASSGIDIYAIPKAGTFNGKRLLGQVLIDGEGVVPPDTLLICQNGKLIERLNSRTPSAKAYRSNGHYLNGLAYGTLFRALSPSNLLIESKTKSTYKELKKLLIENIVNEELEYGLIIKPAYPGSKTLVTFTKVFQDGKEEEVFGSTPNFLQNNILKRIVGTGSDITVSHNPGSYSEYARNYSLICPESLLVKGFEIKGQDGYLYNESYLPSIPMPDRKP